uniref:Uncharacterized protein n=1 Tax=Tetradesmus obliquus TaxID=3088 RepID=A0A383VRB6_TETOB|eukprot:jgi/Sobl393_1/15099/SZX67721.1
MALVLLLLLVWALVILQGRHTLWHVQPENAQHTQDSLAAGLPSSSRPGSRPGGSSSPSDGSSSSSTSSSSRSSNAARTSSSGSASRSSSSGSSRKGAAPKVALLLLVRDGSPLPNEPAWRAFLESAARLQLQPVASRAAAAAARHTAASSVRDVLGGKPLHPALKPQPPWTYPGYRMQHNLTPGALQVTAHELSKHLKQRAHRAGSNSSSSHVASWLQFSAALLPSEQPLLQAAVQRLHQAAHEDDAAAQRLKQEPQPTAAAAAAAALGPLQQVATAQQAAALEAQEQSSGTSALQVLKNSVLWLLGRRTWNQPRPLQQQAAAAQQGSSADSRRLPLHPLIQQQQLFSVYVHTPHGQLLPAGSLFAGCELRWSVNTTRGYAQHVLAEAAVLLLRAALQDELNSHFVVLSDTSIPIYPPQVVWAQLMSEQRSRIDACATRDLDFYRRPKQMTTEHFGEADWRKSSQWFALTRPLAMLAVADSHVRELYHRHCYTNFTGKLPLCVSDEHYMPSLLASYGLDNATDCQGAATYVDFSAGGWHPQSFKAQNITPALVQRMRGGGHLIEAEPKLAAAAAQQADAAAALSTDEEHAAALADAIEATIAEAEADMHAASAAAAAEAAQLAGMERPAQQQQQIQLPPCEVEAAMQSAAKLFRAATHRTAPTAAEAAHADHYADAPDGEAGADDDAAAAGAAAHIRNLRGWPSPTGHRQSMRLLGVSQYLRRLLAGSSSTPAAQQQPEARFKGGKAGHWVVAAGYAPLAAHCPLFARKFTAAVTNHTLAMALSCAGIGLGSWCAA